MPSFMNLNNSAFFIIIKLLSITVCFELIIKGLAFIPNKLNLLNRTITIPFDLIIMRFIEIVQAIPMILWILGALTIIGVHQLTIGSLILLIGLTSWIIFARLVRGEMLRIRSLEFMEAAAVIGASESATKAGVKTLGKACLSICRLSEAPITAAASINSKERIRNISPRTSRAKAIQLVKPINKIKLLMVN